MLKLSTKNVYEPNLITPNQISCDGPEKTKILDGADRTSGRNKPLFFSLHFFLGDLTAQSDLAVALPARNCTMRSVGTRGRWAEME